MSSRWDAQKPKCVKLKWWVKGFPLIYCFSTHNKRDIRKMLNDNAKKLAPHWMFCNRSRLLLCLVLSDAAITVMPCNTSATSWSAPLFCASSLYVLDHIEVSCICVVFLSFSNDCPSYIFEDTCNIVSRLQNVDWILLYFRMRQRMKIKHQVDNWNWYFPFSIKGQMCPQAALSLTHSHNRRTLEHSHTIIYQQDTEVRACSWQKLTILVLLV